MTTLTLELPQALVQEVQSRGISQQGLNGMFIQMVELYLEESQVPAVKTRESALPDGAKFARRLISENRSLFDRLARL